MEEQKEKVQVKAVEDTPVSPTTAQDREKAVLEKAVEQGDVKPDFGLQDDGVFKINLDKENKKEKKDAILREPTESVQDTGKQSTESGEDTEVALRRDDKPSEENTKTESKEEVLKEKKDAIVSDSPLELIKDDEEKTTKKIVKQEPKEKEILSEVKKQILPENIDKLVKFMDETGGSVEDYVKLNRDVTKMDNTTLLREYYKTTKPHLDVEDVDFLFNKNFGYDEESDDPTDIKAKQLAFKEELYNAQNHFTKSKEQYYADLKLRKQKEVAPEYMEAMDYYNNSKQLAEDNDNLQKSFIEKTNNVFTDDFKGFDFKVGDNKYRFKIEDSKKVKEYQSDLSNFINEFLGEDGSVSDAKGYHRALFAAKNADKIANHFYEQGRADAVKENAKKSKNINMDARVDNSSMTTSSGNKIRVVSGESSDKLRIKWK
jgi:hypothetical protein|tara:strand:+ start:825 stop:2117 length:1293 start_codon:yes stop_codon:yes gene_type:complete